MFVHSVHTLPAPPVPCLNSPAHPPHPPAAPRDTSPFHPNTLDPSPTLWCWRGELQLPWGHISATQQIGADSMPPEQGRHPTQTPHQPKAHQGDKQETTPTPAPQD